MADAHAVLEMMQRGTRLRGDCVVPSFTNPNNLSIVTGVAQVHGISGNFFLDPETGEEVMMNDPKLLLVPPLPNCKPARDCRVTARTAHFTHAASTHFGSRRVFFIGKDNETTMAEHGIDNAQAMVGRDIPDVYSAELSEVIFDAGVKLMESMRPDITYLSTTDYIQHKHRTPVANQFYAMMDTYWAQLDAQGAVLGPTAGP